MRIEAPQSDITLILPAYNEARTIAATIGEAIEYFRSRGLRYEILVPADGNDGTREIVRELGAADPAIHSMGRPERSGKGRAVREAVLRASGRFIGYADADNKVPITEFDKIHPLLEQGRPIVVGSRALNRRLVERKQPLYRQVGSVGFHLFMKSFTGLPKVTDTQCGFKFFQHSVARRLFALQQIDGYMFDVEILSLADQLGYEVSEVPVRWRDDGDSRLELIAQNAENVRDILRISWWRRFRPIPGAAIGEVPR